MIRKHPGPFSSRWIWAREERVASVSSREDPDRETGRAFPRISACLIVRDEEAFLADCLESIREAVDEIVVVDTGSRDATPEIARRFGARVYESEWVGDFSQARNAALSYATGDWVLVIDADEMLAEGQAGLVRALVASGVADAYLVNVDNFADDPDSRVTTQHIALFRRDPRYRYVGKIHEQIAGSIAEAGGRIARTHLRYVHRGYDLSVVLSRKKRERNRTLILAELRERPDDPLVHYNLAQEHFAWGEWEDAVRECEETLRLAGESWGARVLPMVAYRLASSYFHLRRWDKAFATLQEFQIRFPQATHLRFLEGSFSVALGDPARAVGLFVQCLAFGDPPPGLYEHVLPGTGSYRAWLEMGSAYEALGNVKSAVAAYVEALKLEPRYRRAALRLASLLLRHEPAERVRDYVVDLADPRDFRVLDGLWEAFVNAQAFAEARAFADQMDDRYAGERELRRGITELVAGDLQQALAYLERAFEEKPTRERAALDGTLGALAAGDFRRATAFLEGLNEADYPGPAGLLRALHARLSGETPRPLGPEAKAYAWQLIRRCLFFRQPRLVDEVVALMVASGVPAADVALPLGKLLIGAGHRELGLELLVRAAREGRWDVDALLELGRAALEREDLEGAAAFFHKATELERTNPAPALLLSEVLVRQGARAAALQVLERALAENPYAAMLKERREAIARAGVSSLWGPAAGVMGRG